MREKNATNDDVGGGELSIPSNLTNFLTHEEAGNLDKVPERERHYTILYFLRGYGAYTHNDNCGPTYMRMAAGRRSSGIQVLFCHFSPFTMVNQKSLCKL